MAQGTDRPASGVYVPIMAGQRFVGHVGIESFEREDAFDAAAVRLLETVTSAMSVALENARLFAETQRRAGSSCYVRARPPKSCAQPPATSSSTAHDSWWGPAKVCSKS